VCTWENVKRIHQQSDWLPRKWRAREQQPPKQVPEQNHHQEENRKEIKKTGITYTLRGAHCSLPIYTFQQLASVFHHFQGIHRSSLVYPLNHLELIQKFDWQSFE
jgi:hypothetical protein